MEVNVHLSESLGSPIRSAAQPQRKIKLEAP